MPALDLVAPFRDLYPFTPHVHQAAAGDMHYVDEGPREAPVVLCVHGNPSWSLLYRQVVLGLRSRFRCVAPDHLGCGLSDQPTEAEFGYRLADHVANLESLILDLDLRRITLLVHDWGGPIGTLAMLRHPERFERLVVTNTSLFPSTRIPRRIAMCRGPLGRLVVEQFNAFARAAAHMAVARPLEPRVRAALTAPYDRPRSARATWRFVDDIPLQEDHPSRGLMAELAAALPRLEAFPTLLLWGEQDWCFTTEFRRELARRMPWARSVGLRDAGHYLFEDDPRGVDAALTEFLR